MPRSVHGGVVAGHGLVGGLVGRLDARDHRRAGRAETDDLDRVADRDDPVVDLACDDRAAAGDGHHGLDRHQERTVEDSHGVGDVAVDGVEERDNRCHPPQGAGQRPGRRHRHDRYLGARVAVLREHVADLELDQLEELAVVHGVGLVEGHHDVGHATWRPSTMCSRVWGIAPSPAATTRMAPSTWAAPAILFFT